MKVVFILHNWSHIEILVVTLIERWLDWLRLILLLLRSLLRSFDIDVMKYCSLSSFLQFFLNPFARRRTHISWLVYNDNILWRKRGMNLLIPIIMVISTRRWFSNHLLVNFLPLKTHWSVPSRSCQIIVKMHGLLFLTMK